MYSNSYMRLTLSLIYSLKREKKDIIIYQFEQVFPKLLNALIKKSKIYQYTLK